MKVLKKSVLSTTLLMLSSFGFVASANDVTITATYGNISSIAANVSSSNPLILTPDSDLDGSTLTGTDALELDVCSNSGGGFIITVESLNGGFLKIDGSTNEHAQINYTLECEHPLTISGVEVADVGLTDLSSASNLFDYEGTYGALCPPIFTCTLAKHASEDIDRKHSGDYLDTLSFTMTTQ